MVKKKISKKNEEKLKEKARNISIKEGSWYAVMDGFGLRNISPFAIAIGASNFQIGLLSSIPSLLGNLTQLFSYNLMEHFSRKKLVALGVFLQAVMWLFLLIPAVLYFKSGNHGTLPPAMLVVLYTILIVVGAYTGPIWSSWMKDLVSAEKAGKYFGKRNKIIGFFALLFAIIGSFILDYFKKTEIFWGFVILFSLSFAARAIGAYLFTKKYEPEFHSEKEYYFSFWQFVRKMWFNNFGKFAIFMALITFAVNISGPFFSVYVLRELGFQNIPLGYIYYFLVMGFFSSVTTIIFMPFWGRVIDKYGAIKIMKFSGLFICFVPIFWVLSVFFKSSLLFIILFLICLDCFSGFVWAGFNLATGTFVYTATTRQRMPLCVAYMSILSGIGVFIGATLGGILTSFNIGFWIFSSILVIFMISAALRFAVYFAMRNMINEVRHVDGWDFNFQREFSDGVKKKFMALSKVQFFEHLRINILRPKGKEF